MGQWKCRDDEQYADTDTDIKTDPGSDAGGNADSDVGGDADAKNDRPGDDGTLRSV